MNNTKAIVIQSTKFGDSSLIVHLYTELFGTISTIIKGARRTGKGGGKSVILQLGNILEISLNYQQQKGLQMLKDINVHYIPSGEKTNVLHHALVSFICEMIHKTSNTADPVPEIFELAEQTIIAIHEASNEELKLLAHFFCIKMAEIYGFGVQDNYTSASPYLNLLDGNFGNVYTNEGNCCSMQESNLIFELIRCEQTNDLGGIASSLPQRRDTLQKLLLYLKIHLPQMGEMRSVAVIQSLFS